MMPKALFVLPQGESHSTKMLAGVAGLFGRKFSLDVLYRCTRPLEFGGPMHELDPLHLLPGNRFFLTQDGTLHASGRSNLAGYDRIAFQSLDAQSARLVDRMFPAGQIDLLVTDNELDGRRRFYELAGQFPGDVETIRQRTGFTSELEQAFHRVQHFVGPETPWRALAEMRRPTPLVWHDVLIPYQIYDVPLSDAPATDAVRIALFPKPTQPEFLDPCLARLKTVFEQFPDRKFELFCFILPHWPKLGDSVKGLKNVTLFNVDSPLPEQAYWEILLRCDAVLLNGRGGLGGILRAVAHRISILDVWEGNSFNREFLRGLGVTCQSLDAFTHSVSTRRQDHRSLERSAAAYQARLSQGVDFFLERYFY